MRALRAKAGTACDYRVKNTVIPANASQCDHWGRTTGYVATTERTVLNNAKASMANGDFGAR
jgi:hypothetical protein